MTESKRFFFNVLTKKFFKVAELSIFPLTAKRALHGFSLHGHFQGPISPCKVRTTFYTPLKITDKGLQTVHTLGGFSYFI